MDLADLLSQNELSNYFRRLAYLYGISVVRSIFYLSLVAYFFPH